MSINDLLAKARESSLSRDELERCLAVALAREPDSYAAILTLGRAQAAVYEKQIAPLLHSPEDPMLARAALYALCTCWDRTEHYVTEIVAFCRGVDWDNDGDVRVYALSLASEYLSRRWDQRMAESLLSASNDVDNPVERNTAIESICRIMGVEESRIPSPARLYATSDFGFATDAVSRFREKVALAAR